jgi:hypothetical protein
MSTTTLSQASAFAVTRTNTSLPNTSLPRQSTCSLIAPISGCTITSDLTIPASLKTASARRPPRGLPWLFFLHCLPLHLALSPPTMSYSLPSRQHPFRSEKLATLEVYPQTQVHQQAPSHRHVQTYGQAPSHQQVEWPRSQELAIMNERLRGMKNRRCYVLCRIYVLWYERIVRFFTSAFVSARSSLSLLLHLHLYIYHRPRIGVSVNVKQLRGISP